MVFRGIYFDKVFRFLPLFVLQHPHFNKKTAWVVVVLFNLLLACTEEEIKSGPVRAEIPLREVPGKAVKDPGLDTLLYHRLIQDLANGDSSGLWPAAAPLPLAGAVLPFKRILAFYGNFYSPKMGVLGALPRDKLIHQINSEMQRWNAADPSYPVIPAIHYIAVSAQKQAGRDSKYRLRMPPGQIERALDLAKAINGLVFLDVQVGKGSLLDEIHYLEPWLLQTNVHLGIDPEFSMKEDSPPGDRIGSVDAEEINTASQFLARLVRQYQLAPKILVVHRFNKRMLTRYRHIQIRPEVQIVINMDGFGFPAKKRNSYYQAVYKEPVQFAGFKLFYKNDTLDGYALMSPEQILQLKPRPVYIQYH